MRLARSILLAMALLASIGCSGACQPQSVTAPAATLPPPRLSTPELLNSLDATPSVASPSPATATPTHALRNCMGVPPPSPGSIAGVAADGPAPSVKWAKWGDLAVIGKVAAILPVRFATANCGWPDPRDSGEDLNAIITPVVVALDGPPIAVQPGIAVPHGTLVIATIGGRVGDNELRVGGDPVTNVPQTFAVGESVLVVLQHRPEVARADGVIPTEAGPATWDTVLKYTRDEDGTATGYGKTWVMGDLTIAIRAAMDGQ